MTEVLTRAGVEDRIMRLTDEMEHTTYEFAEAAQAAATAEANYRKQKALTVLALIEHGERMTADVRAAKCDAYVADFLAAHLTTKATRDSLRESLLSMRSSLDALRTLSASVRSQT